jgi:tetratricopeptide (TPR) repeat protein
LNKLKKMALLASMWTACASAQQSVTVTGQKNASPWLKAESQHFIVFSNTGNDDVRQLLDNLEKLDHVLRIHTQGYRIAVSPRQKITLYYHDRIGSFNEAVADAPQEAVGLYNSCGHGVQGYAVHLDSIAALRPEQLAKYPLNSSLSYIFEAYSRHFLYRYTDIRMPAAYVDGFAQYFSTVRFAGNQMSLGRVPASVARYIYFLDNGHSYRLRYQDVLEPATSKDTGVAAEPAVRLEFLTKSWLLTHYMQSSSDNLARRDQYLNQMHLDVPAGKAYTEAFGQKLPELDTAMWRYRNQGIQVTQLEVPSLPSTRIDFTSLPDAVTDFVLADAALKSCPGQQRGESLLKALSQHAGGVPNNDAARLTLSRAQIGWGKAEEALPYLTEAVGRDKAGAEAFYLLGAANLRLAGQHKDAAPYLQAAIGHLTRARSLNPDSAEAAYALYQALMAVNDKPDPATLEAAIAAWRNAHEVNSYARAAALAFSYSGKAQEADNALTLLAHNALDPDMAKWAQGWQARLAKGVSHAEVLAEMRREPGAPAAFKEWTVASESLMQTVEYNAGIEDTRKYLETMRLANPVSEKNQFVMPTKK